MRHEILIPEPWQEPLTTYLGWMRSARRADGTIYQHSYHLRRYAAATHRDPWPVTLEQLVDYMATREEIGPSALRTMRQVLRGFYSWGQIVGRWESNPAAHLPSIRTPRGVPRPAPEHSVKVGLRNSDERVRTMILLAVRAGMRCREICQVRGDDVVQDLVGWSLIVRGKGDHVRLVPIPPDVAHTISQAGPGWLFPGRIDGHLSPARVSELISAALPDGVTAHPLRHRYGTRAYQLGGRDIRAVQRVLGHASISTTQGYVDVEDAAVRRAALAAAAI